MGLCPKFVSNSHFSVTPFSVFHNSRFRTIKVVRVTSGISELAQRSPDNGKMRGKFHLEAVGHCSLMHSWIEQKLQSRPENLKIWWFLMNTFHVEVVGHCYLVHFTNWTKTPLTTRKPIIIHNILKNVDNKLKFGSFWSNLIILDNKLKYSRQKLKFDDFWWISSTWFSIVPSRIKNSSNYE